jgi:serine phosphatase RsbU (regulator of sigma subunit)
VALRPQPKHAAQNPVADAPGEFRLSASDGMAIRAARHFVMDRVGAGSPTFADDASLVAAELIANAVQHGDPPVVVRVSCDQALCRVEVSDSSGQQPVRALPSLTNMTGRGLALVEALSTSWGVQRERDGGKTVWAEVSADSTELPFDAGDVDALLAEWDDQEATTSEDRYPVALGDVPTSLLLAAKAHIDNLVREFSMLSATEHDGAPLPGHLARLIETVVHGFADARAAIKRQAIAAARRGEARTSLTLVLPLTAADAGEAYLAALDEADKYSRAARLLTLETPPDHQLFRRWYVEAVVDQLRRAARGEVPSPPEPFEDRLLGEIRRLAETQRNTERAARLQRVTAALANATTPEDVASVVLSEGVAALGASGGGLLVPAKDGEHLEVPGAVGYGAELVDMLRGERLDAQLPAATALRTGVAVWLETPDERDRQFPELRGFEAATVAMCAVPLIISGRPLGALRFSFDRRRLFDEDERAFVVALASITAQTLHRTELYEAERRAAIGLQRELLPKDIVAIPGWDIATFYSPAGNQEIGGDFYDVIPVGPGRVVAVVGDVMGRGVEAAAAMAQIRSTIRAYAIDDPDPAVVLRRVDTFFDLLDLDQLVTVLYFLVDETSDEVHVGNAGHLRPLLVDETGARVIETTQDLPLGVGTDSRSISTVALPPGSSLVAITDGLVERRGEDIDEGIDRIVAAARHAPLGTAQGLLQHIIASASAAAMSDDDVTVVVLRRQ